MDEQIAKQREQFGPRFSVIAVQEFHIEEALALLGAIDAHADAINKTNFARFFAPVQANLVDALILSLARLFEPEKGYDLNSIPSVLKLLESALDDIDPVDEEYWAPVRESVLTSYCQGILKDGDDSLPAVLASFRERLSSSSGGIAGAAAEALSALKTHRDKRIAHSERVSAADLPQVTMQHVESLRDFARCFVGVIGFLVTGESHVVNGNDLVATRQAVTARVCMERLLEEAGVIEDPETSI